MQRSETGKDMLAVREMKKKRTALFVGAHPDDIEIGCGGTAAKLRRLGWNTVFLIMASANADHRRKEALASSAILGLRSSEVLFADFRDGHLREDRTSVKRVRDILKTRMAKIDVVFVHTVNDSHNDHIATSAIIRAAFRDTLILGYMVPNSVNETSFGPRVYIDISAYQTQKRDALACHKTQVKSGRIHWQRIEELEARFGERTGCVAAEAMEILILPDNGTRRTALVEINDAPFSRLWNRIAATSQIWLIDAQPRDSERGDVRVAEHKQAEGIELLREAFYRERPLHYPLKTISCKSEDAIDHLRHECVVISGGPVSNDVAREYFNHFAGLRYVVEYTQPNFMDVRIFDRQRSSDIRAEYQERRDGFRYLKRDLGILTLMKNPLHPAGILVGCMGIHSLGTKGCNLALTEPTLIRELETLFFPEGDQRAINFGQVLVAIDQDTENTRVLPNTFHRI